jgi:hypothetical protein
LNSWLVHRALTFIGGIVDLKYAISGGGAWQREINLSSSTSSLSAAFSVAKLLAAACGGQAWLTV